MATGAPGTNGVWQYGEDDSETTFSALLNKAASTTDTQIGADRTRLTALEARKLSGFVPVVAPTVNYSGGTATANTLGTITFTGVTSLSLNGVFTSAYRDYEIRINFSGSTGGVGTQQYFKLRSTGTDNSSAYYNSGWGHTSNSANTNFGGASNGSLWNYTNTDGTYNVGAMMSTIKVSSPQVAISTYCISHSWFIGNGHGSSIAASWNTSATPMDGFTIYPSSGTITGKIAVYGLA